MTNLKKPPAPPLEEHFEVLSLTFHNSKIQSRLDSEPGWSVTPYAYFLLKTKGPEIDSIPPLKIDLDFLDTSGYVVLPIASAAIPIDATATKKSRPHRNLKVTLTLDEREAEKENHLNLEVKATAHGLVPPLEEILDLDFENLKVETTDDNELLISELDIETDDGAPVSTRDWVIKLTPKSEHLPKNFTFPALKDGLNLAEEDSLTLQKYEDVDLVSVEPELTLGAGKEQALSPWLLLLLIPVIGLILFFILKKKPEVVEDTGPALPTTLTPVTTIAFLKRLQKNANLSDEQKTALEKDIATLETQSFSANSTPPTSDDLQKTAIKWQQAA